MAHGGYLGGRLASLMPGASAVDVKLRAPTPLETPLVIDRSDEPQLRLLAGDQVCAESSPSDFKLEGVPLVTYEQAERAGNEALDWVSSRLPAEARRRFLDDLDDPDEQDRCFGCLPRSDGLSILPGRVGSLDVAAAAVRVPPDLIVDDVVPAEIVWAAVDCPSLWVSHVLSDEEEGLLGRPTFTGTLSVRVHRLPRADERIFIQVWRLGRDNRKLFGAGVLVGEEAEILAEARQTAILA